MSTHTRSLFGEFSREVASASVDYTIDGLVILDDDCAVALAYDAADGDYAILEGIRGEEGICFAPCRFSPGVEARYQLSSEALSVITRMSEGFPFAVADKTA